MKRLILIQNDYSGAGKTTLALSLHHYLQSYRVPHHQVTLTESAAGFAERAALEVDELRLPAFISHLDESDLVIMEIETGLVDAFYKFYEKHELEMLLPEMGFELMVLIPVTSEDESFDGVSYAAEMFSDSAQYLIAHTPTSSYYDDDVRHWEHSHAARVMDMFEAVDLEMPVMHDALDFQLKVRHSDLPEAMQGCEADPVLYAEVSKWFRRVASQLDSVKNYLFSDTFKAAIAMPPANTKSGKSRSKARAQKAETMAA
jgi:hypothetical protein